MFQRFINKLFADMLGVCVIIQFDDILIYSEEIKEYRRQVKEILKRLKANKLYALSNKYIFYQEQVKFLGFILSPRDLCMDKKEV